jgi:hypothetical protein
MTVLYLEALAAIALSLSPFQDEESLTANVRCRPSAKTLANGSTGAT